MKKSPLLMIFLLLIMGLPALAADEASGRKYSFAVVPQFPARIIQRDWVPLLEEINKLSGVACEISHYSSIPQFEQGLEKGEPDFAYMNPYHQVLARRWQGYVPLVRDGSHQLRGILVVRQDSPFTKIADLNNQVIAFPSPNALAASLYMRALLVEQEKVSFTPAYVKTHSNVYRHVVLKKAAAGGGVDKTLKKETESLQEQLRVLYETPGLAPHPICVHPRVPQAVVERFVKTLLALGENDRGKGILQTVAIGQPIPADYQRDYAVLEELGLEKYLDKE